MDKLIYQLEFKKVNKIKTALRNMQLKNFAIAQFILRTLIVASCQDYIIY